MKNERDERQVKISCKNIGKTYSSGERGLFGKKIKKENGDKTSNPIEAVKDATFSVMDGELFVIMGLSGSGKSTLARCINGLVTPTCGTVEINGVALSSMNKRQLMALRRRKISMVFQNFSLFPKRTVINNVIFGLEIRGEDKQLSLDKSREMLNIVGLNGWENNYPHELSGGMKQRVGLARALVTEPEILIMDEPFSALDPLIRSQMHEEFLRIISTVGGTVVFITHDLNEAMKLGSRIAIMKNGEIIQVDTPEKIVCHPQDSYVATFVKDINKNNVVTVKTIMEPPRFSMNLSNPTDDINQWAEEDRRGALFVVNANGELSGRIHVPDMNPDKNTRYQPTIQEAPYVFPNQPVSDLIPLVAEHDCTIAVVNREKKLVGEVTINQLLKTINQNLN